MPSELRAREKKRDDEFGILNKEISVSDVPSFETPTKCVKNLFSNIPTTLSINEVTKRIYSHTVKFIQNGTDNPRRSIISKFLPNKLNLTIFELRFDSVPSWDELKSIASYWYVASQSVLFLPTVKMAMLKDGKKLSDKRIVEYVEMMRDLIELTEGVGSSKPFIGTIPLIPIKYSRPIIKLYLERGITAFAVDAGTKDFLNNETDFRSILTEIKEGVSLDKAFIYACNLGIPQFEVNKVRADDFLSLFAYVDAFGSTFKTRGGYNMPIARPRVKRFLREELSYEYLPNTHDSLSDFNQREQLKESDTVRNLVGVEKIRTYLDTKKMIDQFAIKRLSSIAEKVKPS